MTSNDGRDRKSIVKASGWRIFNGLIIWIGMAAAVSGVIAVAEVMAGTTISYNSFNFAKFMDTRLWLGLSLGILLVSSLYRWIGSLMDQDSSFFTDRLREDLYSNLVSFGWLFILSSLVLFAMGRAAEAIGNIVLGLINLIAVYFLAAKHDEKELKQRAEAKTRDGNQAKAGNNE
ncbi:hypothetical protein [Stenotrophomonas cyclobalanopsidis]|uniref:hypothetical protein n=1 Tax=Stenotrophomonas cyclobalanopsidis TaxID=2771362 RepID=UPI0034612731